MTDKASKLSVKGIETKAVQAYLAQYPFRYLTISNVSRKS
jgi:hypothetical protein